MFYVQMISSVYHHLKARDGSSHPYRTNTIIVFLCNRPVTSKIVSNTSYTSEQYQATVQMSLCIAESTEKINLTATGAIANVHVYVIHVYYVI
jgi:hypothetical protein